MLPRRLEALPKQLLELYKRRAIYASQNFHILVRKLEWGGFETEVAWRVGEEEAKVDMHDVAVPVEEDVPVVTVFDLEEEGDDGVACEGFGKVSLCAGELCGRGIAVCSFEVVQKCNVAQTTARKPFCVFRLLDRMDRNRVGDSFH